jgi:hypothetical protein
MAWQLSRLIDKSGKLLVFALRKNEVRFEPIAESKGKESDARPSHSKENPKITALRKEHAERKAAMQMSAA